MRTHEHEMVAPRVDASFNETLLNGDGLGGGVVGDAEVGRALSEVVEGACGVGAELERGVGVFEGAIVGLFGLDLRWVSGAGVGVDMDGSHIVN